MIVERSIEATVDSSGTFTGVAAGTTIVTVTSAGHSAQITVNVGIGSVPASLAIVRGNRQYRPGLSMYGVDPQVRALDARQLAVHGVAVTFKAGTESIVTFTDSAGLAQPRSGPVARIRSSSKRCRMAGRWPPRPHSWRVQPVSLP